MIHGKTWNARICNGKNFNLEIIVCMLESRTSYIERRKWRCFQFLPDQTSIMLLQPCLPYPKGEHIGSHRRPYLRLYIVVRKFYNLQTLLDGHLEEWSELCSLSRKKELVHVDNDWASIMLLHPYLPYPKGEHIGRHRHPYLLVHIVSCCQKISQPPKLY